MDFNMRALTNNTLIAISRHTNKVLKLANYMAQSEQPLLLDNIYMIDDTTAQKDALEFFQKDLDKTVDLIEKSHQLLSTVRPDNIVEQLDNNEKNIANIFGDKYDSTSKSLELPAITVYLKSGLDKSDIRDSLTMHLLDINYKEFREFIKNCDKIYKLDEYSIETEDDAIEYLASLAYREKYDNIINKIKDIAGEFSEYRNDLGLQNRSLIDNEITFTRSMIDSVMKNSTYITKDSIEQIASPHKKDMQSMKELYNFIKDNNYVNAIELDPDTNLKGVLDILNKTKDLKLNIEEQFCLKCRKLGNYNANGLYLPNHHIAAVDITNPSALIHELTHTADISNTNLFNHKLREELIGKYRKKIDINDLSVIHKKSYYLNSEEIIARLGEISYILNKNDYKGEEMGTFIQKIKENENVYNSEFLNIAKPINEYLTRSNIYFNFEKLAPSDLLEIKDYFQSYFGVNNDDIKPIYSKPIYQEEKIHTPSKRSVNAFKDSPFVKLDQHSIEKALDYNLTNNLIPFENLFSRIAENIHMIARTKKTIKANEVNAQFATIDKLYNWVANQDNDIKVSLIKNTAQFIGTSQAASYIPVHIAMYQTENDMQRDKVINIYKSLENCRYLNDYGMSEFRKLHGAGFVKVVKDMSFEDIFSRLGKEDVFTHALIHNDHLKNFLERQNLIDLKQHTGQIVNSSIQNGFEDVLIKSFNYVHTYYSANPNNIDYKQEQIDYMKKHELVYLLREGGYNPFSFSLNGGNKTNNLKVLLKPYESQINENNTLKGLFDDKPILGTNKVEQQDFKEIRKRIMEEYIQELQKQQAAELKSISPETNAIVEKLKEKIKEDETKPEVVKIEEPKDTTPIKPIKVDKGSQIKLF